MLNLFLPYFQRVENRFAKKSYSRYMEMEVREAGDNVRNIEGMAGVSLGKESKEIKKHLERIIQRRDDHKEIVDRLIKKIGG